MPEKGGEVWVMPVIFGYTVYCFVNSSMRMIEDSKRRQCSYDGNAWQIL